MVGRKANRGHNDLGRGSKPLGPTTHSFEPRDFLETSKRPAVGGLRRRRFGLRGDPSGLKAILGELSLGAEIPFPGNRDRSRPETRFEWELIAPEARASGADGSL